MQLTILISICLSVCNPKSVTKSLLYIGCLTGLDLNFVRPIYLRKCCVQKKCVQQVRNKPQTAKENVSFRTCFIQFCYFGWLGFKGKTTSHHCSLFVRSRYFYSKCMIERKRVVNSFISFLFYFFFQFSQIFIC